MLLSTRIIQDNLIITCIEWCFLPIIGGRKWNTEKIFSLLFMFSKYAINKHKPSSIRYTCPSCFVSRLYSKTGITNFSSVTHWSPNPYACRTINFIYTRILFNMCKFSLFKVSGTHTFTICVKTVTMAHLNILWPTECCHKSGR